MYRHGKNTEVPVSFFGRNPLYDQKMEHWSVEKKGGCQKNVLPHLKSIEGLIDWLKQAKPRETKMGTGSAAMPFNINLVLENPDIALVKNYKDKYLQSAFVWHYLFGPPCFLGWIIYM